MKILLGTTIAILGAYPALASPILPAPAPDLGIGIPAVLAVVAAYAVARFVIRRSKAGLKA